MQTNNQQKDNCALRHHQIIAAWVAGALTSALCLVASPAWATPPEGAEDEYEEYQEEREETQEEYEEYQEELEEEYDNDGGYFMISPGVVMVTPRVEQVGYQWGAQFGYIFRGDRLLAFGIGGNFEHGLTELGIGRPDNLAVDHQFRVQAEAMPGISLADDDLFLYLNFGLGYAARLERWRIVGTDEIGNSAAHGVAFSPGVGFNYRVARSFTIGASVGGDLQWLDPAGTAFEAHNFDFKVSLGWMF